MRRSAEFAAWTAAAAAPLLVPTLGWAVAATLAVVTSWRPEARAALASALRALPAPLVTGVVALAIVHVWRGTPWLDPLGILAAWLAWVAVAGAPGGGLRRRAMAVGAGAAVVVQGAVVIATLGDGRAAGWVGHPNVLAAGVALTAVLAVLALPGDGPDRRLRPSLRLAVVVVAGLAMLVVVATGSRGAWVGATLGASAWALLMPVRRRRERGVRAGVLLAFLVLGLAVAAVRGFAPAELLRADVDRALVQGVAVSLAAERPVFGQGGGAWAALASRVEPSIPATLLVHAHALPLHVAARGGAVALVLALFVLVGAAQRMARAVRRRAGDDALGALALCLMLGIVAVQSVVDLVAQHPTVYVTLWLALLAAHDRGWVGSPEPGTTGGVP